MKELMIVGAGTFSCEVEELACLCGYTDVVFVDDNAPNCIGKTDDISSLKGKYNDAIVAIGNNENRERLTNILIAAGYRIPTLIHPTAYVSPDAILGRGCIVRAKAVVSRKCKLGDGVIVNAGAIVDHHCVVGEYSHLLVGAIIRNQIEVKARTWVNANEVLQ